MMSSLSCGICLENIITDIGCVEACGHIFHMSCGNKWIVKNHNCPMCRSSCTAMRKLQRCPRSSNSLEDDSQNPSFESLWTRIEEFNEKINAIEMDNDSLKRKNYVLDANYLRLNANIKKSTRDYKIFQQKNTFMIAALNKLREENFRLKESAAAHRELIRERKDFDETMRNLENVYFNKPHDIKSCNKCRSRQGCAHSQNAPLELMELELVKILRSLKKERDKNIRIRVQIEETSREADFYQSIKNNPEYNERFHYDSSEETQYRFPPFSDFSRSFMSGPFPNHESALDFVQNINLNSNLNPFYHDFWPLNHN